MTIKNESDTRSHAAKESDVFVYTCKKASRRGGPTEFQDTQASLRSEGRPGGSGRGKELGGPRLAVLRSLVFMALAFLLSRPKCISTISNEEESMAGHTGKSFTHVQYEWFGPSTLLPSLSMVLRAASRTLR